MLSSLHVLVTDENCACVKFSLLKVISKPMRTCSACVKFPLLKVISKQMWNLQEEFQEQTMNVYLNQKIQEYRQQIKMVPWCYWRSEVFQGNKSIALYIFYFIALLFQKSQHGCVRRALQTVTCNHVGISPADCYIII